jgi:nucleoside-diphosphate-sugar epimerase
MFGEGEPKEKFVRYVIESLLAEEKAVCKNPDLIRDYMYVGEVARALRAVLESDFEGAINVASGKKTKIGDLAKAIGRIMGKPQLIDFNKSPDSNEPKFLAAKTENLEKIYRMQKSQIECLEFLAERLKIKI